MEERLAKILIGTQNPKPCHANAENLESLIHIIDPKDQYTETQIEQAQ